MSDKYIIKNCNVIYFNPDKTAICNDLMLECPIECKERTDCLLKQIVKLCREAHGQIIGYEKGKIYDGKNLIEANLPLTTVNPLAKEILDKLDRQECE